MSRRYHWVMTLQAMTSRGLAHICEEGTIDLAANETRQSAYYKLLENVKAKARNRGIDVTPAGVLFWSLEPNDL